MKTTLWEHRTSNPVKASDANGAGIEHRTSNGGMTIALAFLQNMWVKRPEETRRAIERFGETYRVRLIRYALFAGCKTGRNLKRTFGDELIERIVFEETTREIAGDAKTIFPADPAHIKAVLAHHRPLVVLTFGGIAHEAVRPYWTGKYIHAHHPASRHPESWQTLVDAAKELRCHLTPSLSPKGGEGEGAGP